MIVKITFNDIFRQSARITDENVIQYMLLCSWALQTVRARYHKERFDVIIMLCRLLASNNDRKSNFLWNGL